MKQLVTRKMARVLAECCTHHESRVHMHTRWYKESKCAPDSWQYKAQAAVHQKFVDVIQELMARRMVIQGKGKGI